MTNQNCQPLVSVYTCVFNGEKTLHRVFKSLKNITYPNIEHIIINDGSTDNTENLIKQYSKDVNFPVKYFYKENGGKHTALNIVFEKAEGEFMIQLDADDELLPNSISYLVNEYYQIPEDIRDQYWCVHARCVTQYGDFVGDPYPEGINTMDWKTAGKKASLCGGEKLGLQVTKYISRFRFPEPKGVYYYLPESIVWKQINCQYGTWYTNEVLRVYYVNEGGNLTSKSTNRRKFGAKAFYRKWCITHPHLHPRSFKNLLLYSLFFFIAPKEYRCNNKYLDGICSFYDKFCLSLLYLPMFFGSFLVRKLRHIEQ